MEFHCHAYNHSICVIGITSAHSTSSTTAPSTPSPPSHTMTPTPSMSTAESSGPPVAAIVAPLVVLVAIAVTVIVLGIVLYKYRPNQRMLSCIVCHGMHSNHSYMTMLSVCCSVVLQARNHKQQTTSMLFSLCIHRGVVMYTHAFYLVIVLKSFYSVDLTAGPALLLLVQLPLSLNPPLWGPMTWLGLWRPLYPMNSSSLRRPV